MNGSVDGRSPGIPGVLTIGECSIWPTMELHTVLRLENGNSFLTLLESNDGRRLWKMSVNMQVDRLLGSLVRTG